ncbi:nucleoside-diphosphate-sugar epimerase [Bacillus thuringiensis]|uniref:Nucleoside-diphosphate-sugar epimerase n=1 Tax=Bacillus thuringiensis TaxID=1428 RepID=A0A4R4B2P4_BACTU|nr:NAD(P)-dependent oxidoreductase [Bacillus thuringiensis]TCW47585.1 nucleoside-diphosphate-sugar epimerase [Bacillus thuringiensis]TCW47741.1 nucleoside-diphosphate-sugar epimerase [Bacillus thuringiensis]
MKVVVFGGTGFTGSHIIEQLILEGHAVTIATQETDDIIFFRGLVANIVQFNKKDTSLIQQIIKGHDVVYNLSIEDKLHTNFLEDIEEEIEFTKKLIISSAVARIPRFIHLSSILIYDFQKEDSIDESYVSKPEYQIQKLVVKWEKKVHEVGQQNEIKTCILRPAISIGTRDRSSLFTRLLESHSNNLYPLIECGNTKVSLIDARDIGRAMVWLGTYECNNNDNEVFLVKGFNTTWYQLKQMIDTVIGNESQTIYLPKNLTNDQIRMYNLTPFTVKAFSANRLINDNKIRKKGFITKYNFEDTIRNIL